MEKLGNLFGSKYQKPAAPPAKDHRSERGDLLTYFHEKINATRDGKKFKKLSIKFIAVKLSHLNDQDLYFFKRRCEDAKDFSKFFWWSLDPKKHETPREGSSSQQSGRGS